MGQRGERMAKCQQYLIFAAAAAVRTAEMRCYNERSRI